MTLGQSPVAAIFLIDMKLGVAGGVRSVRLWGVQFVLVPPVAHGCHPRLSRRRTSCGPHRGGRIVPGKRHLAAFHCFAAYVAEPHSGVR